MYKGLTKAILEGETSLILLYRWCILKSKDRPDRVCRLFKIKLDHLIKDIKGEVFRRKVKAGYPLFTDINRITSIEILDKINDLDLFRFVSSFIIHGLCGAKNQKSPCITTVDFDGYPLYRRRDNGRKIKKGEREEDTKHEEAKTLQVRITRGRLKRLKKEVQRKMNLLRGRSVQRRLNAIHTLGMCPRVV
ncbi:hypothetical protein CR513_44980, partial [Mucuna pruriens]